METFYLVIIVVLILLALSDLVVGVSNDAVNFLNSALGSKAAPLKVIIFIAGLGVLVGAVFSEGMMEVARKGIFHPQKFYFNEIMIIFLAVMLTDVILLDLFNTFGLPTSTTVSIVFELLGAAVGISIIKIYRMHDSLASLSEYINSAKALAIIIGILSSVVISFVCGAVVQYISRVIFSFNYAKPLKYFGGIWGGICVTAITYFLLLKGLKGSSIMTPETQKWIAMHKTLIIWGGFIGWSVIFQILQMFRVNTLKIIVLLGTFALAMAFAGNDLVNFVGVPLAGLASFKAYLASGAGDPGTLLMAALQTKIKTPTLYLLISGAVMVLTLYLSKKARSVVKTTLDLSRQNEGTERFESSMLARSIVRTGVQSGKLFQIILPKAVLNFIDSRFDKTKYAKEIKVDKTVSFDLIRASVNLLVASILIAIATSYKLPLSTTYVTFMVAMGTSLSDRAWNRESAVYRISGVITVIGGWFFTALSAFTVAFVIANIISFGGIAGMIALFLIAFFLIYRTHAFHTKREESTKQQEVSLSNEKSVTNYTKNISIELLYKVSEEVKTVIDGLVKEKRKKIFKSLKRIKKEQKQIKLSKKNIHKPLIHFGEDFVEQSHMYVEVLNHMFEVTEACQKLIYPVYEHVDNIHTPLKKDQEEDLKTISKKLSHYILSCMGVLKTDLPTQNIEEEFSKLLDDINNQKKKLLKQIKKEGKGSSNNILCVETLSEMQNLASYVSQLINANVSFMLAVK